MTKMESVIRRKIVTIDESKCNGCGICIPSCVEGALQMINGKAKLVSETYCDGLGACIGECPQGAISIEERKAPAFDEKAAFQYKMTIENEKCGIINGCPGSAVKKIDLSDSYNASAQDYVSRQSLLGHWPVQLTLVPPSAAFLKNADIVLAADCVPFAYADFHRDFLRNRALLIACPKLDNFSAHKEKLTSIIAASHPGSITVVHMEVPCCSGLVHMAGNAVEAAGLSVPLHDITIGVNGAVLV
jgi:ferredoxin